MRLYTHTVLVKLYPEMQGANSTPTAASASPPLALSPDSGGCGVQTTDELAEAAAVREDKFLQATFSVRLTSPGAVSGCVLLPRLASSHAANGLPLR